ncbi:MAG: hypothetical protein K2Y51_21255 [Gammaproteobacteria bacterium]|nr:hypothetical protein [Gammaproteobacteria bacterium]
METIALATDVDATLTLAQNALLGGADGDNTVTLATAGETSGAAEIETYRLANGTNDFTLGSETQNVIGGTGADVVRSGELTSLGGSIALGGGSDGLVLEADGIDLSGATLSGVESVTLAEDVSATLTRAQNALLGEALGTNTVTLADAGVASGAAQVENYLLADGANTFTLGASAQNVTGGTGDDHFKSGSLSSIEGSLDGGDGDNTLTVEQDASLTATLANIASIALGSGVDLTTDLATASLVTSASGVNTVTVTDAGVLAGAAEVESYVLADGGNDFTLGAAAQNVTGGDGNDLFLSGALTTVIGTLVGGEGDDTLLVQNDLTLTASLVDIEEIVLDADADLTVGLAGNALLGAAAGDNTVTLSAAGSASGAAEVEHYVLANGANSFTLGADAQNVTGGTGSDTVHTGDVLNLSGTLALGAGADTLVIDASGANLGAATLTSVEAIQLATDVAASLTLAQNALLGVADGDNSVTLLDAGAASGAAAVEHYQLADGANVFTLGAGAQDVTGGAGDDVVHTGPHTSISGTLALGDGFDTVIVDTTGSDLSAATLTDVETLELATDVDATLSLAQNALLGQAAGANTVTLAEAGVGTGAIHVEDYRLADGANDFTLGAVDQDVTGGSGDDLLRSGALGQVSGALAGGAGDDTLLVEQDATVDASLTGIDHLALATDVDIITSLANHALLDAADGDNTVTLSEAGVVSGAQSVEHYVLADGANTFTLGDVAQDVTGGTGDDVLHTGAAGALTGSLALGAGDDRVIVDASGTSLAGASLSGVEAVDLAEDVAATLTLAQHTLLDVAAGDNTVTLAEAGTLEGHADVEHYVLADGGNSFTLGAAAQDVTAGTGDDVVLSGGLASVSGTLDGGAGADTLVLESDAVLTATLSGFEAVDLASGVDLTTGLAANALIDDALGTNTVTLTEAGVASGAAQVENYVLADGANTFTLGASLQNVTGGSEDDVVHTGAIVTVGGTLAFGAGDDTLVIDADGASIAAATLTGIEAIELGEDVATTLNLGQNALLGAAAGDNTVTLSEAGSASGAAEVEHYVLADGGNTFTLGASGQDVTGGSGDDALSSGGLSLVSGALHGGAGNDSLAITQNATLSATLTGIETVTLASDVDLVTNVSNHSLIGAAAGHNTVTLSEAGIFFTGLAEVEHYVLADGPNTMALGAADQDVTGGSGDDVVQNFAFNSLSGEFDLGGGFDTLGIYVDGAQLQAANLVSVELIELDTDVDVTVTLAQNALIDAALGNNTVTLSEAGTVTGKSEVEAYVLANGTNDFTLGADGQDVTGGSGDDTLRATTGQLAGASLAGGAGSADTLVLTSNAVSTVTVGGTLSGIEVMDLDAINVGVDFTANADVRQVLAGSGADTLNLAAVAAGATVSAGAGADTVTGGAGNDSIDVGVDGDADLVNAGGGSDTVLNFGAGDTINLEGGADTAAYAAVNATVDGGTGGGADTLEIAATTGAMTFDFSQTNAQQVTVGGTGTWRNFENLAAGGASHALTVTLASGSTSVVTGSGDDRVGLRVQNVSVDAGAGIDTLAVSGGGALLIDLSTGGDQLSGLGVYTNFENVDGASASATMIVIGGENTAFIHTGSGNDTISGGVTVNAGGGSNNIVADARTTIVTAGAGADSLDATGAAQGVTVNLGDGANAVLGSAFDDVVTLGAGVDTLALDGGSDTVIGTLSAGDTVDLGADDDSFTFQALGDAGMVVDGGAGSDTLVIAATSAPMTIDFSDANDNLAAESGSYRNFDNLDAAAAIDALTVTTSAAGGTVVTGSGDDLVTLGAASDEIATGAGDDTVVVDATTIAATIDGGANTVTGDTLQVTGGGTVLMGASVTGMEHVSLASATDFTANATAGLVIAGSAGDDRITVGAADQVAQGAGGDDVIVVTDALLGAALTVDGGSATLADSLEVSTDADVADAVFANVSDIERLVLSGEADDDAQRVVLAANAATAGIAVVDADGMGADDALELDASAFNNALQVASGEGDDVLVLGAGGSVVTSGDGDDTVTVGAVNNGTVDDDLSLGDGDDRVLVSNARLTGNLTVDGGDGLDVLEVTTDANVVDGDFAQLSSLEVLSLRASNNPQNVTLGAQAVSAGLTTIEMLGADGDDALLLNASGFTAALTVTASGGTDQITLGSGGSVVATGGEEDLITVGAANDGTTDDSIDAGAGADRVLITDAQLSAHFTLDGGDGTDVLEVSTDADVVDADFAGVSHVETLTLGADAADNLQSIVLGAAASAAGLTTLDADGAGDDDIQVDATAFAGALHITTGAGVDQILLGSGGSVVDAGDGNNSVALGADGDEASDHVTTGSGDDLFFLDAAQLNAGLFIDSGAGADQVEVSGDAALVDADFDNLANLENLVLVGDAADNAQSVVLGANAVTAGITHFVATTNGGDAISVDAGAFIAALDIQTGAGDDVITLGSGGSVVNAGSGDNLVVVGAANDGTNDDQVTTGGGDDRVELTGAQLSANLVVNAGGGDDVLAVTTDASVADADLAGLSGMETLSLRGDAGDDAQSVVLAANAASAGLRAVDANLAGADDALTLNASTFANALEVLSGAGADHLTLGAGGSDVQSGAGDDVVIVGAVNDGSTDDTIDAGAGDDRIELSDAQFTAHLVVDGGADQDSLLITSDAAVVDADFTLVSNLEVLKLGADAGDDAQSVVLGSLAVDAGLARVDGSAAGGDDALTLDAGAFSAALEVLTGGGDDDITLGSGGSVVDAGNGDNTVVVGAANDDDAHDDITTGGGADRIETTSARLTAALAIDAGGGSDTLEVVDDADVVDADFAQLDDLEILELTGDASDDAQQVTLGAEALAAGIAQVDADAVGADDTFSLDASAFAGALSVSLGDATSTVLLGSGGSVVTAGNGAVTITVGAANDGTTDDSLTLGGGNDRVITSAAQLTATLTLNAGNGSDVLEVSSDATLVDGQFAGVSNLETLRLAADADDDAQSVTLGAAAAAAGLVLLDASTAGADDDVSVDTTAFANTLQIALGAGDDEVVLGTGGSQVNAGDGDNLLVVGAANDGSEDDVIVSGAGDDRARLTDAQLSANFSFSAGAGDDVVEVTSDASVADADLAGLGGVETLVLSADAGDNAQSVALAANAASAGIGAVDASGVGATDAITVDASAFTAALDITTAGGDDDILLGSGGSTVDSGAGDDSVTVGAANDGVSDDDISTGAGDDLIKVEDGQLSAHLTVAGGDDDDVLEVQDDASIVDADLAGLTGIETLRLIADAVDNGQSVALGAEAAEAGITTINAGAVGANDALNMDTTAFDNALTLTTGAGNDVIVLGAGGSQVTSGNGNDTITLGAVNDSIASGAGNDTLVVDADTIGAAIDAGANTGAGDLLQVVGGGTAVMGASVANVERVQLVTSTDFTANAISALDITGSSGNDRITVGAGDQVVDAGGGDDTIAVTDALLSNGLVVEGGAASSGDTLEITTDAALTDADFAQVTGIEILTFTGAALDGAQSATLAGNVQFAGVTSIDTSAAEDDFTLDLSGFTAALNVIAGAGDDTLLLGSGGGSVQGGEGDNTVTVGAANDGVHDDNITLGSGDDRVLVSDAQLRQHLAVAATTGTDTLEVTTDAAVVDADFAQLTGFDRFVLGADAADNAQSAILGANAAAAGFSVVDAATLVGGDDITLDLSGFTAALAITTGDGDDEVVLGSGGSVLVTGAGSATVTVGAANDGLTNDDITTGGADDLVKLTDAQLTAELRVAAGGGADTLEITTDANVEDASLAGLEDLEVLSLAADAADDAQSVTLGATALAAGLTTVDSTGAGSDDAITIDATAFTGALEISGGAGDDVLLLGSGGAQVDAGAGDNTVTAGAANDGVHDDAITTGAGDDRFLLTSAQLSANLTISAGAGSDVLEITTDATVLDGVLAGISGVEILRLAADAADGAQGVLLGTNAAAAGLTTLDASGMGATDALVLDATAFAAALAITAGAGDDVMLLGSGGSVVNAGDGNNHITVGAANDGVDDDDITTGGGTDEILVDATRLTANLTVNGGGGSDTLLVGGDAAIVDADLAGISNVEILMLEGNAVDNAQSVAVGLNAVAAGIRTVDLSALNAGDAVTLDASAFNAGLTVKLHAGVDNITLGDGDDVLLGGVSAGDDIDLGAGDDAFSITTLAAVTIEGGTGLDTLVIGAGAGTRQVDFSNLIDQLSGDGTYLDFENLNAASATGQLSVIAGSGTTSISTGSRIDQVDAGLAAQGVTISTGASGDAIIASDHDDMVNAGSGDDLIAGGLGNDQLTGGAGVDTFVFDSALNGATNVDTLGDFLSGTDLFELHLDIFAALESTDGVLNADNFIAGAGAVATTTSERIILDTDTGSLYYDADGNGAGACIEFARLDGPLTAHAGDFLVV